MKIDNIITFAEELNSGKLSYEDAEVKKAQVALSELFKTEEGRNELAEIVRVNIDEAYNKFDIGQYIFDKKHFNYGDNPVFRTHKKGIIAYWTAMNSYVPMSQNYDTEITMNFETLGVHPYCNKLDLQIGKVGSYGDLIKDSKEAVQNKLREKAFKILAQTYNGTVNADNYFATNTLDKVTLDKAINKVRKETGANPIIIGDYDLMAQIEGFAGFDQTDEKYIELRDNGVLGMYRGCKLIYLANIIDPVTNKSLVPTDKLFVVGGKIGYEADYGKSDIMQEIKIEDKSWHCTYDRNVGYVVVRPERLALIDITGA